jgi:hypothetical protein
MSENVQFAAKVSKVKTRTKGNKSYYAYRLNIPSEIAQKIQLNNNDYFFVQVGMKAKWYHMLDWKQMPITWNMLPSKLKEEIQLSGVYTLTNPIQQQTPQALHVSITEPLNSNLSGITSYSNRNRSPLEIIAK